MSRILISHVGHQGDGVAVIGSKRVFVPYALAEEEIDYNFRPHLLKAGEDRVSPPCIHHGNVGLPGCGGCRLQHMRDDAYRAWKRTLVVQSLKHLDIDIGVIDPLHISPPYSRRRAALTAERIGERTVIGFNRRGSHHIVDMHMCLILKPELTEFIQALRSLPLLQPRERADYIVAISEGAIDWVIERKPELNLSEREMLAEFAERTDLARISWRKAPRDNAEPVVHRRDVAVVLGEHRVTLPPGSFLQATEDGQAALTEAVMEALPAQSHTLDLFAGIGTFSIPALTRGQVHAIEGSDPAVKALSAVKLPGLTSEQRDLFKDPLAVKDLNRFNTVIFDPPYVGAKSQTEILAASRVPIIIAVSCNPSSFARDAATLMAGGYHLTRVVPVDQFLWSAEIELMGVFRR